MALFGDPGGRAPSAGDEDEYSLFHRRSESMGWLDTRGVIEWRDGFEEHVGTRGLWALHDAGTGSVTEGVAGPPADYWFHVGVEPLPVGGALPTQALLRCIGDVVAMRQSEFRLRAVQFVLPTQLLDVGRRRDMALAPSVEGMGWLAMSEVLAQSDPVPAKIEISLPAEMPRNFARNMAESVHELAAPLLREALVTEVDSVEVPVLVADHFWDGPSRGAVSIRCEFQGWTFEGVGWLAGFVADFCARNGFSGNAVVTASAT
ncbi:hypothetical protein [Myceligenerans indicum]|uniref:Uncharacterized protein n=1 Tax=Myceligenerans indicum TaxID=2593663 RepID=A0ABS1LHE3_9MICO|nr:hypothetical protein [Myceligenerans indicum]MBL0885574.1 hypothetical protein [Myceligenerans indicum]